MQYLPLLLLAHATSAYVLQSGHGIDINSGENFTVAHYGIHNIAVSTVCNITHALLLGTDLATEETHMYNITLIPVKTVQWGMLHPHTSNYIFSISFKFCFIVQNITRYTVSTDVPCSLYINVQFYERDESRKYRWFHNMRIGLAMCIGLIGVFSAAVASCWMVESTERSLVLYALTILFGAVLFTEIFEAKLSC